MKNPSILKEKLTKKQKNDPRILLRMVREILKTPEAEGIIRHAHKVMHTGYNNSIKYLDDRKKELEKVLDQGDGDSHTASRYYEVLKMRDEIKKISS